MHRTSQSFKIFSGLSLFSILGMAIVGYASLSDSFSKSQVLGANSKEYILRYSTTDNGGLTFTGNSLGLTDPDKIENESAGTFISTDKTLTDSVFPEGSTKDWVKNSSSAKLNLPKNASVLYAELIWGGSYKYETQDISSSLNNSIKFSLPNKQTVDVKPDAETSAIIPQTSAYVRSSNVTDLVKKGGLGNYTVSSVPALLDRTNPYNNYAGWTLAVAYKDTSVSPRNLSIFVGSQQAGPDQINSIAEVKGFNTPASGAVSGRLLVSAQEGDSMFAGDQMRFGADKTGLKVLSGPNNKADNFFAAQINNDQGKIDTSGTFGSSNLSVGKNSSLKRQGWDVTNVDISPYLKNSQQTAYAQGSSLGDVYVINALGIQIEANAANPLIQISVDKSQTFVGDTLTYTTTVRNNGTADSIQNTIKTQIPEGTSLVPNSIKLNGKAISNSPTEGVKVDSIKSGETVQITYQVSVEKIPNTKQYTNQASLDYSYQMINGGSLVDGNITSNIVVTTASDNPLHPPVANDDKQNTQKAQPVSIDILNNDTDQDNNLDTTTVEIVNNPRYGKVVWDGKKIIYTPNSDYVGQDTFIYKICDTTKLCDTAIVTIDIADKPVANPPVANDDKSSTKQAVPVTINSLINDTDSDDNLDSSTLATVTLPKNGKVEIVDGKFVYTPNSEFYGTDTFTYKICDKTNLCDEALVSVDITQVKLPNPPVATDDSQTTKYSTPVLVDVLANDTDPDGNINPQTLAVVEAPKNGQAGVDAGKITYTPKDGFFGEDSFTYKICDETELCTQATVKVVVDKPIDPVKPDAKDDISSVIAGESVTIKIVNNDIFADSPINSSSLVITNQPANGTVKIDPVTNDIVYTPNKDFTGQDSLEYKVCNQLGGCDTAQVVISVSSKSPELIPVTNASSVPTVEVVKLDKSSSSESGQVLGVMESVSKDLVRTGGAALGSMIFLGLTLVLGLGGMIVSFKKPTTEELYSGNSNM